MEKGNGAVKKVFTVIVNIIIWLFVIFSAVITVLTFAAQSSEDGVPAIAGKAILTVSTDSMSPTFEKGDIILGQKLLPEEQISLKKGDIITFDAGDLDGDNIRDFNTHRIDEVINDNGKVSYITMGDNRKVRDENPVKSDNVIAKYTGTRFKGVGKVLAFLQTPKGFLYVIVLPLILLFLYELIKFIRKLLEAKGGNNAGITAADAELIRRQAVEEYLRSQGAAPATEAPAAEEPAEAPMEEAVAAEEPAAEPDEAAPADDSTEDNA